MQRLEQNGLEGEQLRRLERQALQEAAGAPQPALVLRKIPLAAKASVEADTAVSLRNNPGQRSQWSLD